MPIIDGQRGVYNPLRFVQADSCSKRTHQNSGSRGATMKLSRRLICCFICMVLVIVMFSRHSLRAISGPLAGVNDVPRRLIQTLR